MNKLKFLLFLLLFLIGIHFFQINLVSAQEYNPYDPKLPEAAGQSVNNSQLSLPSSVATSTMSTLGTLTCALVGGDMCVNGVADTSYFRNYGLIQTVQNANIAILINQPASTGLAFLDLGKTFGFVPERAYAQGIGISGLSPILSMWRAFRNISYILLSIVLIVIGFMIMFRSKIDPHTVITVQQALPNIVISLILITFSYAIVALLIDLSYVILLITHSVFVSAGLPSGTQQAFLEGNMFQIFSTIFPNLFADFGALFGQLTGTTDLGRAGIGALIGGITGGFLGGPIGVLTGAAGGAIVSNILIQFLIGLLFAILLIRIFFLLLGAYIQVLLRTILGPLQLVMGAVPGQKTLWGWVRALIANISVPVVVGIMFMLSATFDNQFINNPSQAIWSPPYFPFQLTSTNVSAFFVIGMLMLTPQIANMVKKQIAGDDGGINAGGAIMGGFTGVTALGMQAFHFLRSEHHNKELQKAIGGKKETEHT